ncbi:MAG: bifunctional nicotinamidase/pyrazinamidase [Parachlamydiaceae bacterium]|nr:bifunctional nicotinamidase/pyrazinamidase [Parachlamydiaceae bacterium]
MKAALIVVDLQNDFLPGGALPVKEGLQIISLIDQLLRLPFAAKIATKDWHPANHGSFAPSHPGKKVGDIVPLDGITQILWPIHCVQNSKGAEFAPGWDASSIERIFYKGTQPNIDSYSTFFDNEHLNSTGLSTYLKEKDISTVFIAGLATDYCVKYSVIDACHLGLNTFVITDACRGVNLQPNDSQKALEEMQQLGAHLIQSDKINKLLAN